MIRKILILDNSAARHQRRALKHNPEGYLAVWLSQCLLLLRRA